MYFRRAYYTPETVDVVNCRQRWGLAGRSGLVVARPNAEGEDPGCSNPTATATVIYSLGWGVFVFARWRQYARHPIHRRYRLIGQYTPATSDSNPNSKPHPNPISNRANTNPKP